VSEAASSAAEEGPAWSATAQIWIEHWARLGAPARELIAVETGIGPGKRVLDMGCGSGEFCALAAERGADVAAVDAAEGMLAIARERLPSADLRVGAIERLPWDDGSFDIVTGFNSFQFAAEPHAPFREARRVVRPGGMVAVCVWGPRADNELPRLFNASRTLSEPVDDREPGAPRLGDPGELERAAAAVGLSVTGTGLVEVPYATADLDELERALELDLMHSGTAESVDRAELREVIASTALDARQPDGSYRFENRFRWLIARA
jgi:SAM-dependent methyltransferase